jgi:hypothetical protein
MKTFTKAALLCLAFQSVQGLSADCRPDVEASTPVSRFTANGETVTDNQTTLTWTRCAIGQIWKDGVCQGLQESMSLADARATVITFNRRGFGGYHDWRLPVLPELASIVERKCFYPRINETVFPGTPSSVFWSGMFKRGSKTMAYALDFGSGETMALNQDREEAVRLVRGGPWWIPPATTQQ